MYFEYAPAISSAITFLLPELGIYWYAVFRLYAGKAGNKPSYTIVTN